MRVLDRSGEVVGAGFLVGRDLVATCAHVVASAVGGDPTADDAPTGQLRVDFPLVRDPDSDRPVAAAAQVQRWVPIQPDGGGDVAVLRLDRAAPPGVRIPPVRRVDALWGQDFEVLGFPAGRRDGVWATGTFRAPQGTRWCQLQGRPGDQRIEAGFSGAPVWAARSGAVVGMMVAADRDQQTTTAYLIPVDAVLGLDPDLLPCPYRSLEPFGEEHRQFYFGRTREIQQLADAVSRHPLVAVAGPSGVGKSSLVMAGLLPLLRDEGVRIVECRPAPGISSTVAIAAALLSDDPQAERELANWLGSTESGEPAAALVTALSGPTMAGTLLFVDQFEELAATEPAAARELVGQLVRLIRALPAPDGGPAPLRVVLTLRWESLNELLTPELVGVLGSGTVPVPSMGRAELREVIVGPAECAPGLGFADGLVDRILDDAGDEPGRLPLVESLLTQLWQRRDEGGYLTVTGYDAVGGVSGAVARQAEDVLTGFADPADMIRLRRLFIRLAAPDEDGQFIRHPVMVTDLPAELTALLEPLVAGRLLVQGQVVGGPETVELAHQALIDYWPRLRRWLAEDQDFLTWRAELDRRREQWEAAGREDGALLRGSALAQALERLPPRAEDVPEPSRGFIRRSQARQRREIRRWRIVTAVLVVLLLAAAGLSFAAVDRGNRLNNQLNAANAETLGRESDARAPADPVLATRLALAAWRADPTSPAARAALADRFVDMSSAQTVLTGLTDTPIQGFPLSRDGDVMLLDHAGGIRVVAGLAGRAPQVWDMPGTPPKFASVAFSSDGRRLATADAAGTVLLWDIAAHSRPVTLHGGGPSGQGPSVLQFSPDSNRLVWLAPATTPGEPHQILVWDLRASPPVFQSAGPVAELDVSAVWLTTDPNVILLRFGSFDSENSRLVARALSGGAPLRTLPAGAAVAEHGAAVLACVPDGLTGTVTHDAVLVLDAATGAEHRRFALWGLSNCRGRALAISSDGGHVVQEASAVADHRLDRVVDLADGTAFTVTLPQNNPDELSDSTMPFASATRFGVLSAPDGQPGVLLARNGAVLRLRGRPTPWPFDTPGSTAVSMDGRFLLHYDGNYSILDPTSGTELGRLAGEPDLDRNLGYGFGDQLTVVARPAQDWVATEYRFPRLEETARYQLPGPGPDIGVFGVGFDFDRTTLVTLVGGVLTVWDRNTHQIRVEPVQLGTTAEERQWWLTHAHLWLRPGRPDEVALATPDSVLELWDLPQHRRIGRIPTAVQYPYGGSAGVSFDAAGNRLAMLTADHAIEVWDVNSQRPIRPPIPAAQVSEILGFDADGYLLTSNSNSGPNDTLAFWDLGRGAMDASMRLGLSTAFPFGSGDGRSLRLTAGFSELSVLSLEPLPVTAQQWFDRLCAIGLGGFTKAELSTLPPGTSTDPPCA